MSEWNFMSPQSKGNLLGMLRREADGLLNLASEPGGWEAPTAAGHWQVRDVVGHMVDTTEAYFRSFDAARGGGGEVREPLGLRGMNKHVDEGARAFQGTPQGELVDRLRSDYEKMHGIFEGLSPEEWAGLMPPHKYMGPIPAFFYVIFQLVDYGIHSWDVRQGSGRAHAMDADTADLLVPLIFGLWPLTANCGPDTEPFEAGVVVTGRNGCQQRARIGPEGLTFEEGSVEGAPVVFEFDPASFVLTGYGRTNAGTARGDQRLADRFLNLFFRI